MATAHIKKPTNSHKAQVGAAANDLLSESKKFANEMYSDSKQKIHDVEDQVKEYSDKLSVKVQENPLASVLIAGGIGFILSKIFRK